MHQNDDLKKIFSEIIGDVDIYDTIIEEDELAHYGMPRRSGRYPWGSGDEPFQHSGDFLSRTEELKKKGLSEAEIAATFEMSTTQLRAFRTIANNERRALLVKTAETLKGDGLNNTEIAKKMGLPGESSVRSLLDEGAKNRMSKANETVDRLKKIVDEKGIIDIGGGVELDLGISPEKLKVAEEMLYAEGYEIYNFKVQQVSNPGKWTTVKALCPPGTEYKDAYAARDAGEINSIVDYESINNGEVAKKQPFVYPESLNSKRLMIRYAEDVAPDGHKGIERDGMIELRRGVDDLNLGDSHYAQVRIMVDGTHYIKGMAVYNDNLPEGVDVVFNTNKKKGTPMKDVLKKIKDDPENPFGSLIKEEGGQSYYIDKNGEKKLSLINKRAEEGDWGEWADHLPSQFLGKQHISLIQRQIDLSISDKKSEYDEIMNLTNPTVKKKMLQDFAQDCDASAVYLQTAALPRQKYQVIIPIPGLKDNEIYAPNYNNGEILSLVRYPHGGTFEIPQLRVNNKNIEGRRIIGEHPLDAVGINSKVAERLSGADFDGDTVMVIPTNSKVKITSTPALQGLKGFDSKEYKYDDVKTDSEGNSHYYRNGKEFRIMNNTQREMGVVSNLITDMTLKGATTDELARATRHSMVVIDAEKHKLDYKQSEVDNDIQSLKNIYQNGGGASTLLSRAKGEERVDLRKGSPRINLKENEGKNHINPKTGKEEIYYDPTKPEGALLWKTADDKDLYYTTTKTNKKTGEVIETTHKRILKSTKMMETDDANTLSSGTPKEKLYADYANELKNLANQARISMSHTGKIAYDKQANKTYKDEVDSLKDKLLTAEKNRPRERQAQILANSIVEAKKREYPGMEKDELRKVKQKALTSARNKMGAHKTSITMTDREWDAVQAGAISENLLTKILNNMDGTEIKKRATPKDTGIGLSDAKISQIKAKANSGYSTAEIAESLGYSTATIRKYLK